VVTTGAERASAVADLIGALTYALLRSFQTAAQGAAAAPTASLAARQAAFAEEELARYRILAGRLAALTPEPDAPLRTLRAPLDAFYDAVSPRDWLEAQAFHFVGGTITTDFADILAARLDPETAEAVRRALTARTEQEGFALGQIEEALRTGGEEAQARVAAYVGTMVGKALAALREALLASDALEVVLGEGGVKESVLELLGRHRERLERIGLDTLE
jgi:hypothetical protein